MKSRIILLSVLLGSLLIGGLIADNKDSIFVYASDFDEVITREAIHANKVDQGFAKTVIGKILLQVEENGEAWYVSPENDQRYYLGSPDDAFALMREQGLGVTTADLEKIPEPSVDFTLSTDFQLAQRLAGMILLQADAHGEAWYVNPDNLKRYYLGRPKDAFELMRELGLGITNENLRKIGLGQSVSPPRR